MKHFLLALLLVLVPVTAHAQFKATGETAGTAYLNIKQAAARTKSYLQAQKVLMQQPTVSATIPLAVIQHFATTIPRLDLWAAAPGLATYAQGQEGSPTYDVAAQYSNMRKAMVAATTSLVNMFPKDGTGYLLYQQLALDGSMTIRTFTAAQVAAAVTLIDAVIGSIE